MVVAIEEYTPDAGFGSTDNVLVECEVATTKEQMAGGDVEEPQRTNVMLKETSTDALFTSVHRIRKKRVPS